MDTAEALERLGRILPLAERQEQLPRALLKAHRAILRSLLERGKPLSTEEMSSLIGGDGEKAIVELARNDLVVLDDPGKEIRGAYPMTTSDTPHHLSVNGQTIQAMCALDALAVAPMFGVDVTVDSVCHVTGDPVRVVQEGSRVVEASPGRGIHVGVRWGPVDAAAAGSL